PRALHEWNGDRAVDHHVRDRRARYGAEQTRRENRHLARPSGRMAGKTHREIHKKLARSCSLHERAEHHEDQDVSSGYRKRNSENAFGRHIKLVEQPHRLDASNKEAIGEKYERRYRKRGTNDTP